MTEKVLLLFSFFSIFHSPANAFDVFLADTTIIEFLDKSINKRVTVISTGNKEIELPITLNLNELLKKIGIDSLTRKETILIVGKKTQDTLVLISKSGERIQIISKSNKSENIEKKYDSNKKPTENDTIEKNTRFFSKRDFGLYLGPNNFSRDGIKTSQFQQFQLKDWKSRCIAFSFRKNATMHDAEKSNLAISYGPELVIYHFSLENSHIILNKNNQTTFEEASFTTKKSKLTIPYVNFPVVLNLGFKESKYRLALGAYAGYRIGASTKTKAKDGNKEKIKNNYNLSNFLYGVTGEIGKKNCITGFIRYDLNKLFNSDQTYTRELQAFSFGIRL